MTSQLTCDECGEAIRVENRTVVGLLMTCGCDDSTFSIKTAVALPREWSTTAQHTP